MRTSPQGSTDAGGETTKPGCTVIGIWQVELGTMLLRQDSKRLQCSCDKLHPQQMQLPSNTCQPQSFWLPRLVCTKLCFASTQLHSSKMWCTALKTPGQQGKAFDKAEQQHLFSLFGQLGIDISLAPAQQVRGNQVTQHNSTLVCR